MKVSWSEIEPGTNEPFWQPLAPWGCRHIPRSRYDIMGEKKMNADFQLNFVGKKWFMWSKMVESTREGPCS